MRAPRVSYTDLYINDEYWGFYVIVEQIDKTFLKNNFADDDGNLWKNQRWSELKWFGSDPDLYRDTFELKTNEDEDDWSAFIHFLDVLNNYSDAEFEAEIESIFNVDQYLHVLAVDIMTNNWDSYIDNERNFYLYHEPKSGKIHWIPWDYNLAMGGRISLQGDPYPPHDPFCVMQTDFNFTKNTSSISFDEYSEPAAENWLWDFGDNTFSNQQNPEHIFNSRSLEKVRVCLTSSRTENGNVCEQKRCKDIDLTFNPSECTTIQNGECPYPSTDPVFQQTITEDPFCCSDEWDVFCEIKYQEIANNPPTGFINDVDYNIDFPLILNDSDKVLIDRLLSIPKFKDRYLEISCIMLDRIFTLPEISTKVDAAANLIRDAVHADERYLYTHDFFEYDVGNGTGGNTKIPALKYFMNQRIGQLSSDLADTQFNCSSAFTNVNWHDIVVNEFVASNQEAGGISDPNGEFDDWIELYNNSFQTIDLHKFYLSDDSSFPKKWIFPEGVSIAPNEYLIVWADKDPQQSGLHTDFGLSKSGEELLLVHEDGTVIDMLEYGEQTTNVASARIPNGAGDFVLQGTTFGINNEEANSIEEFIQKTNYTIFPNPAGDFFSIQVKNQGSFKGSKLVLSNTVGETVFEKFFYENIETVKIDSRHLSGGVYFLEIKNGEDIFTNKVIIH